jgi:hypothetical protein
VRTLPLRLAPIAGESLPGYVARYAHTFRFPPGEVIHALGLDGGAGGIEGAGRYGVSLSPERLAHAAFATRIAPEVLEGMLLSRYAGRAFELSALQAPAALARAAQAHEVLIWSSRFCPRCLRQDGAWRVRWQLAWSVACPTHRVLLHRVCPRCGLVPAIGKRWSRDRFGGDPPDPRRCPQRIEGKLCRARLTAVRTSSVPREVLDAQRWIDELLDGRAEPTLAGAELPSPVYLRDLLTLCNLLELHGPPAAGQSSPAQTGRRLHDHPEALAALLPAALALADLPNPDALAGALRELADRRYRADGQTLLATKSGPMSDHLKTIVRRAVSQAVWASASRQLGIHPSVHRRPDDLDPRLQPRHVPQLFWSEDYQREIACLFDFDDFTHWLGRRFCSVLLVRMLKPINWEGAVRYLEFPDSERFINDGYSTTFAKLRTHGRFDELARRAKRIANQHADQGLVDYKQRRALLADWTGIDAATWPLLQPRPRPQPWRVERTPAARRAHASVWLWSQLTSGHERAAPVALPRINLGWHTYFVRDSLPALRERLLILGELLLQTPADARQTLPTRLAATLHKRGHLAHYFYLDIPPLAGQLSEADIRGHRVTPSNPPPPYVEPVIAERVLTHVAAHTGVDVPSLTTRSRQPRTPPAIRHARRLAAALLRQTALASWAAIAATIGGHPNRLADDENAYRAARERDARLASELDQLVRSVDNWKAPAPPAPTTPHRERMESVAAAIKTRAEELFSASHGANAARRASIVTCGQHTDLTTSAIAAIHGVEKAQTTFSDTIVVRRRLADPDFDGPYRQLLTHARELQRQAGFANAHLTVGLASSQQRPEARGPTTRQKGN